MAKTIKSGFVDETTSFPVNVWIPPNTKYVKIYSFSFNLLNEDVGNVFLKLRVDIDGGFKDLGVLAINRNSYENIPVTIPTDFQTDAGNGTNPVIKITTAINITEIPRVVPNLDNFLCKGVVFSLTSWIFLAIFPSSVSIPVSTIIALHLP